jgi:uncharacterized protein (DUF1778 family)
MLLTKKEWDALMRVLENPPKPTKALIELMRSKPVWER